MEISEIRLYNFLRPKLGDEETQELIGHIRSTVKNEFMDREEKFLTKDDKMELIILMKKDKIDLIRSIFIASVANFLAIVGTLLGILSFMLKK